MTRVGLLGFEFAADNLGCEALTYSLLTLLRPALEGLPVTFRSFEMSGNLGTVPELFPEWQFESTPADLKHHPLRVRRSLDECDLIIDATYGDSFSDIYIKRVTARDLALKELAVRSHAVYVLAPQTYGPFRSSFFRRIAADVLRRADLRFARDARSAQFVERIAGESAPVVSDLAFALPYERGTYPLKELGDTTTHVGVNVSGLLWRGGFGADNQFGLTVDYREYVVQVIQTLLDEGCSVHLVPHVIGRSSQSHDDDYETCQTLVGSVRDPRVMLAPRFSTCMDAKSFISGLDFLTGARMHATIAAYSTGVAVAPFSYSRKFEGVFEGLDFPWVVPGTQLKTDEAVAMTLDCYHQREPLARHARESAAGIQRNLREFASSMAQLIQ